MYVQGGLLNYVVMKSVLSANREVLLDVQGTNVWSGQAVSPAPFDFSSIFNVPRRSNHTILMLSRGVPLVNPSTLPEADTEYVDSFNSDTSISLLRYSSSLGCFSSVCWSLSPSGSFIVVGPNLDGTRFSHLHLSLN